jgi:hypothetical protein
MGILLVLQDVGGEQQARAQGRLSADRDIHEGALGKLDGIRRREDEGGAILLKDHEANAIPALIGIREQGKNRTLGGIHALGNRHGPRGIHQEEHEVGDALDADLALKIRAFDGECEPLALFDAAPLKRGSGAEGGVECDIVNLVVGGSRLDIAAVLALGLRQRAATSLFAGELVERCVQPAWPKGFAGLDLLAAVPPFGV